MNPIELDESNLEQNVDFLRQHAVKRGPTETNDVLQIGEKTTTAPPKPLAAFLAIQNVIITICGIVIVANVLAPKFCILPEDPARAYLLSTVIMTAGISTLLQTCLGVKLPIMHSSGFVYMIYALSVMNLPKWKCPVDGDLYAMGTEKRTEEWQYRIRHIQGAIISMGIVQMILGYSGVIGKILKYIRPLTVVPTMCLIGVSVFENGMIFMSGNWAIAIITLSFLTLFSQYLRKIKISIPVFSFTKFYWIRVKIFALFSIMFSVIIMWIVCNCMSSRNYFSATDPANTESKSGIIRNSQPFRIPYPFQWGWPIFNSTFIIAMIPALLSSIVESVGNYYICARYANLTLPPKNVVARGISIQGFCLSLAGVLGINSCINGSSENVGNIGITQICSRNVIMYAAGLMILFSPFIKIIAIFVALPDPILGAVMSLLLALIVSVALSNLQFINLNSMRNMYILGISLCFGLILPRCISEYVYIVDTKYEIVNNVVFMYMSSGPFIGGLIGFILDNTISDDDGKLNGNSYSVIDELQNSTEDKKFYMISDVIYDILHFFYTYLCCD